jgi:MOSC domain-containing protein YiiM
MNIASDEIAGGSEGALQPMKVLSVQVGKPKLVKNGNQTVLTGIFKQPVARRVHVFRLNLEGDQQADLRVHGGPDKAVYVYPSEHYLFWRSRYPDRELAFGTFGENVTTQGLLETEICIGDRLRIGSAEAVVTQPRMPCYKLGIKFGDPQIIQEFHESRRSGFYLRVKVEGELGPGDPISMVHRDPGAVSIADFYRLYAEGSAEGGVLQRLLANPSLPEGWRRELESYLST